MFRPVNVPPPGVPTMMNVSGRLTGSEPVSVIGSAVFSVVDNVCGNAIGDWFVTVTVMTDEFAPPMPSVMV